jgi:hypothetical protein
LFRWHRALGGLHPAVQIGLGELLPRRDVRELPEQVERLRDPAAVEHGRVAAGDDLGAEPLEVVHDGPEFADVQQRVPRPKYWPSRNSSSVSSPISGMGVGRFVANVSTDHTTFVFVSNRARVVGLSYSGGRLATSVRSPTSMVSPSLTKRHRLIGVSHSSAMRPIENQVVSSVALGQAARTANRLPAWSRSSWVRNTHFTSSGSTTDHAASSHCGRTAGAPVSTRTGSAPRITIEFIGKCPTGGASRAHGMTNVSSAI